MTDTIATDLAALAADNRRDPRPIDVTLRRIGTTWNAPVHVTLEPSAALLLMSLGRVFAHRVARTASAAVALALTLALVVACYPFELELYKPDWADEDPPLPPLASLLDSSPVHVATYMLAIILAIYLVTLGLASRRFERAVLASPTPLDVARARVRRFDGRAIAVAIAGMTTFVTVVGVLWFALRGDSLVAVNRWGGDWGPLRSPDPHVAILGGQLIPTAIVLGLAILAAVAIGYVYRSGRRIRALEHRALIPIGIAIGIATLYLGSALDVGPIAVTYKLQLFPSLALRTLLTVTGTTAVFLALTGLALWRRRTEHEHCKL